MTLDLNRLLYDLGVWSPGGHGPTRAWQGGYDTTLGLALPRGYICPSAPSVPSSLPRFNILVIHPPTAPPHESA